jgi:putative addiction module component (TIGR02574 family)
MGKPAFDVSTLSTNEKLDLIDDLWRSLPLNDPALNPALCAELDRRLDRLDRDGPVGVSWDDVYTEMTNYSLRP